MEERESVPKTFKEKETKKRLIVILDGAQLETVKNGNDYELLNCDDHTSLLRKRKRDASEVRPDITHQVIRVYFLRENDLLHFYNHFDHIGKFLFVFFCQHFLISIYSPNKIF